MWFGSSLCTTARSPEPQVSSIHPVFTDSDTSQFGSIALSMKELYFTVTTFLFLLEFSLRRKGIRVSGVVVVVTRNGFASFDPPSSRMCRGCLIGD